MSHVQMLLEVETCGLRSVEAKFEVTWKDSLALLPHSSATVFIHAVCGAVALQPLQSCIFRFRYRWPIKSLIVLGSSVMECHQHIQPYPAEKLELDLDQIRLVSLRPGRWTDPLICELNQVLLEDSPAYCALSYVWGDRSSMRLINLNNASFLVTSNLEAALRRLRHPTRSLHLWVDMLCIDQSSTDERTHQVNLMSSIYSGAREAVLWLGDYKEDVQREAEIANGADPGVSIIYTPTSESEQGLSRFQTMAALSLVTRLATGQHMPRVEDDTLPRQSLELQALDRLMCCSW